MRCYRRLVARLCSCASALVLGTSCTSSVPEQPRSSDATSHGATLGRGSALTDAELIDAPQPLALTGDADARAAALADEFAQYTPRRAAALLAAFGEAGLPVVDGAGHPIAAGGEVGMPWAAVWGMATAPDEHVRIPLSALARVVAADPQFEVDPAATAQELVTGLRRALSFDNAVSKIARLVRVEALRSGGPDLRDPKADALRVSVTMPTASVLVSAMILVGLTAPAAQPSPEHTIGAMYDLVDLPSGCAEDEAGQWALWIASKIAGGAEVGGVVEWKGVFPTLVDKLARATLGAGPLTQLRQRILDAAGKTPSVAEYGAAALTAITTVAAVMSYTGEVSLRGGEPLVRTRSTYDDGESKQLDIAMRYDLGKLPPEVLKAVNCTLVGLAAIGNNSTFTPAGPIADVEVTIAGRQGFGQGLITKGSYVVFPTSRLKDDTDADGKVSFPVAGRAQPHTVPDSAPSTTKRFSVQIDSRLESTGLNTLVKMFLDSILCAGKPGLSCLDPIADVAKQFRWSIGERSFTLTDYTSGGFRLHVARAHIPVADSSFDIEGDIQGCQDARTDRWTYSGTYAITNRDKYRGDSVDEGYVLDLKGGQQPEGASLTLGYFRSAEQQLSLPANARGGAGDFALTDPTGRPVVRYVARDGYGDTIGTYGLGVTEVPPECDS